LNFILLKQSQAWLIFVIIARENGTFKRRIREAIEIHRQTPTINRDNGYELPPTVFVDVWHLKVA